MSVSLRRADRLGFTPFSVQHDANGRLRRPLEVPLDGMSDFYSGICPFATL
jgi:hypothetical protein